MADQSINIGRIVADLDVDSGNLERGLAGGRQALDAFQQELRRLGQEFSAGSIGAGQYLDRVDQLNRQITDMNARMQDAYRAVGVSGNALDVFNRAAAGGVNASAGLGRAMMQLGYVADDLQYSFSAAVNNIGPLALSLGMGSGLAGSVQLAAIGVNQLYLHWDQLAPYLGMGKTRTEADEMAELAKQTGRTAEEQARLNKYKKEQHEIEEMMGKKPKAESDASKALMKGITEADPEAVEKGVFETMHGQRRGDKAADEETERAQRTEFWKNLGRDITLGTLNLSTALPHIALGTPLAGDVLGESWKPPRKAEDVVQGRLSESDHARAQKLMVRAADAGDKTKALESLIGMVKENTGAFPPGFLKDLQDNLPENRKQQQQWEDQGKANAKAMVEASRKEKKDNRAGAKDDREDDAASKAFRVSNLEAAELVVPGLKKWALEQLRSGSAAGEDPLVTRGRISRRLQADGAGMAPGDADLAARDAFNRAREEDERNGGRWKETQAREDRKKAEGMLPGLNEVAERAVMSAKLDGTPMEKVAERIANALENAGFTPERSAAVAGEVARDANEAAGKKVIRQMLDGPDAPEMPKSSRSEVGSTADLNTRIQSAITDRDDETKKQTGYQEQMVKLLAELTAKGGVKWEVD